MSDESLHCTNHPDRETALRCGKCDKPMCTSCLLQTPVGLRCRRCANLRPSPVYDVSGVQLTLATVAGLGVGVLGGLLFFAVVGPFSIWLSPFFGLAVGEAVSRVTNRKRGPALQLVVVVSIVAGAILGKYGLAMLSLAAGPGLGPLIDAIGRDIWLMLFAAIAVFFGLGRVR